MEVGDSPEAAPGTFPGKQGAHTVMGAAHTVQEGTRAGKGGALTGSLNKESFGKFWCGKGL